jgi:hypothetical protein
VRRECVLVEWKWGQDKSHRYGNSSNVRGTDNWNVNAPSALPPGTSEMLFERRISTLKRQRNDHLR